MKDSVTETPGSRIAQTDSLYQPLTGSAVSEDDLTSKPALPPQIHLFKSQVILNPTISRVNFVAYLIYSTYLTLIVLPAGLLALPLLKIVYGLPQAKAIDASAITQVCTLLIKFIIYPIFGALCDKYGRRIFVIIGVIMINAGIIVMPNLPDIYPCYILASVVQDIGLTSLMIPPLLADYVDYETKGRVAGISGVLTNMASFVSTFITSSVNVQDNIPAEYHYIGIAGLAIGGIIILGLKGGKYHKALFYDKKAEDAKQRAAEMILEEKRRESMDHGSTLRNGIGGSGHQDSENIPIVQSTVTEVQVTSAEEQPGFKAGIREAKRNPWILMGYLGNFLHLSIAVVINGTLVNYVPATTGNEDDANQAYNLANKEVLAALVSVIFFGYAVDKLDKFKILVFSVLLSIAAVVLMVVAPSPYNFLAYVSMACFGVAAAGIITFTTQVLSKYPNPKYRASVAAVGGMCSFLGQVWIGLIGMGVSQFYPAIPFYLYFGSAIIVLGVICKIYISKRDLLSKL